MKLSSILGASLLLGSTVAAKAASSVEKFQTYHRHSLYSAPLDLDEKTYEDLTSTPRDYSVAVLLTATEVKYHCKLCKDFAPEWDLIGKSWVKGDKKGKSRVIFSTLDFKNGKGVFQKLGLQTAPVLLLFHATTGPNAKLDGNQPAVGQYVFQTPQTAEQVYHWISRHLPDGVEPKPPVVRPFNYARLVMVTTSVLGLITFITVAKPYVLPVVQNRKLWAGISLVLILLFTSGHMFNHIRKVPYVSGNGKGGISYFAGGFQTQYGMETQVVASMYGVLSFTIVALAIKVPKISDPKNQQVAVLICTSIILGMYSFLLSVFRIKNAGYPFWLPPF